VTVGNRHPLDTEKVADVSGWFKNIRRSGKKKRGNVHKTKSLDIGNCHGFSKNVKNMGGGRETLGETDGEKTCLEMAVEVEKTRRKKGGVKLKGGSKKENRFPLCPRLGQEKR